MAGQGKGKSDGVLCQQRVRGTDVGSHRRGHWFEVQYRPPLFSAENSQSFTKGVAFAVRGSPGATSCRFGLPRKTLIQKGSSMAREKLSFEELDHLEMAS